MHNREILMDVRLDRQSISVINLANEEIIGEVPRGTVDDADEETPLATLALAEVPCAHISRQSLTGSQQY